MLARKDPGSSLLAVASGRNLTYEDQADRRANRVLIVLVVITIAVVAFWGVNGGLENVPVTDESANITG